MAIDFPASPTNGQTFTSGSVTYTYDGTKWTAVAAGGGATDIISEGNTSAEVIDTGSDGRFVVTTEGSERLRCDSSGRLLVGTSTAFTAGGNSSHARIQIVGNSFSSTGEGIYAIGRGEAPTSITTDETLGNITFCANDGSEFASIRCQADANAGSSDYPGKLVFSTTADGASSPTERFRISSGGALYHNPSLRRNTGVDFSQFASSITGAPIMEFFASSSFYGDAIIQAITATTASTVFSFLSAWSNTTADREFNLRGDGVGLCDQSWNGGGADYAEYFEWSDSNPAAEDRRGISVVLDGDKIRQAVDGEDPIGVISGNPSVVGDSAWNKWSGKYLRDDYGTYILEDYEVEDEEGNTVIQQRRKLNPAYDPDQEYVPRENRPEWDCVGLMGKLRIRKGQPTGSRWIKMRDISDSVEEWLVR